MDKEAAPSAEVAPASDGRLPGELSAEEFHRKMYDWLEDRGLLSDLRSHLRTRMISVLKETPIGRNEVKKSISPKIQAMNLLVAEFLMHQNCFYSLSVFSTEVPLANILPELNNNFIKRPDSQWKFEEKDALDILETIKFEKSSEHVSEILRAYYKIESNDALLICILKTVPKVFPAASAEKEQFSFVDIAEILRASTLPLLTVEQILQKLTQARDSLVKEQKEKYEKLSAEAAESKRKMELALLKLDADRTDYCVKIEEIKKQRAAWEEKNKILEQKESELTEWEAEIRKQVAKNEREIDDLRQTVEHLRQENDRLEELNVEQRRKADKLKLNARLLSNELSAARQQRKSYVASVRPKGVSFSGEGEQLLTDSSAPLVFAQPHHLIGDVRRRHNGHGFYCSSSDETQNVDVLQETKERLQRLQQENDRIDRKIDVSLNQQRKYLQPSTSSDSSEGACSPRNVFNCNLDDIKLQTFESAGASSGRSDVNLSVSSDLVANSDADDKKLEVLNRHYGMHQHDE